MTDSKALSDEAGTVQKQAEASLGDAAWRLQNIIEGAHFGTWEWNVQTGTTAFNDTWAQIVGYRLDELSPTSIKTWQTLVHPDDLKKSNELLERHFAGELPYYDCDCRMKHKDGHWVWVHDRGQLITRTEDGKPLMMFGIHIDITERKRAEETVLKADAALKKMLIASSELVDASSPGVDYGAMTDMILDIAGAKYSTFNTFDANGLDFTTVAMSGVTANFAKASAILGFQLTGKKWKHDPVRAAKIRDRTVTRFASLRELTSPVVPDAISALVERTFDIGEVAIVKIARNAKEIGDFNLFFSRGTTLQNKGLVELFAREIGLLLERSRTEQALRESDELFSLFMRHSPIYAYIKDVTASESRVLRASDNFSQMIGISGAAMAGKTMEQLFPVELAAKMTVDDWAVVSTGEILRLDEELNGRKYTSIKFPIVQGGRTLLAGYTIDITDLKQAEEEKQALQAQLLQSQKMEAIGTLAGGVAHDFNNLLTGILGNIALMRASLPPANPLLENLNAAETAARRAADLTKGLLTYSRNAIVLPVVVDVDLAVGETLDLLRQSLPATITIVRNFQPDAWNILADRSQLTQILLNLAVNARDAMDGRGTLTISVHNEVVDEEYSLHYPFARAGEFVHLRVSDTGPGLPDVIVQHLFEPFYTTKPVGSGTGLGLSIVYGAVKQAGGWITAGSTQGTGTTFDIFLPRSTSPVDPAHIAEPVVENTHHGMILVVEDESVVSAVARTLLSRSGYTVLTAPDGASALDILQHHPVGIRLILLDMTMPGMTTAEIIQAIRDMDPKVPILLNSGYTSNDSVKHMLEEGSVQGFLGKPYDLQHLLENVEELLRGS